MSIPGLRKDGSQNKKNNVFINYRVHDTAGETGRLVDRLKQHFYEDQIFMDIDKIEPGVDFTKAISKSLEICDIMLAIIGPNWLGKDPVKDLSRIKNPNDWVKLEVTTALQRDIRVVPVLVNGAELPASEDLPDDLQPLLLRQSYEISNKRWDYDSDQLVNFLMKLGVMPKNQPKPDVIVKQKTWWQRNSWWFFILLGVTVTLGILLNIAEKNNLNNYDPADNSKTEQNIPQQETQPNIPKKDPVINNNIADVAGTWTQNLNGVIFTYNIMQNGVNLSTQVYQSGQPLGSGSGSVSGNSIEIYLNINGTGTTVRGTLSPDEETINGSYIYENTGQTSYFTLVRQE